MKNMKNMKKRATLALVALLTVAMLLPCLSFAGVAAPSQDREPSLKDSLLIHYNFEGNTLEEQLSDKAGEVNTNLSIIDKTVIEVNDDGSIKDSSKYTGDPADILFTFNGQTVLGYNLNNSALVTGVTEDIKATTAPKSEGTWYLRVYAQNPGNRWNVLLNMRKCVHSSGSVNVNNWAGHRPFYIATVLGNLEMNACNLGSKSGAAPLQENNWMDIAAVRTYDAEANTYTVNMYGYLAETGWTLVATQADISGSTFEAHSANDVIMSLFNEAIIGKAPIYQPSGYARLEYDDIRYYTTALTTDDLTSIRNELVDPDVAVDAPAVAIVGAQRSVNADNTYSVRLLAQIKGDAYTAAGFTVTVGEITKDLAVTTAYLSVIAEAEDGTLSAVTAEEGYYLIAVTLTGIPADTYDELTLLVTPYATVEGEEPTTGRSAEFVLSGEKIQSATWAD